MHRGIVCGLSLAAILVAGCASSPDNGFSWPKPRPIGERAAPAPPDPAPAGRETGSPARVKEPEGPIDLRRAMALALVRSPALDAFGWRVRAAEARALQAGRGPNPELALEVGEFGGTGRLSGTDSAELTLSLARTFPLGGDVTRRTELARQRARLAGWDYEAARVALLTEVTRRYVYALAAKRRLRVAREELALTEAVLETTDKRFRAGTVPEVELIRARVPVAKAEIRVRRAERNLRTAERQLALTWNQRKPRFETVYGALDRLDPPPPYEELLRLVDENPKVERWAAEIGARRAEAALARAERVPDPSVRIGRKRLGGIDESAWVAGVSFPLPVADRQRGKILAARRAERAAHRERDEARRRVAAELDRTLTRLNNAYDEAVALSERALPPARQAFEIMSRAFQKGDVEFLEVLDAERTLVELRSEHVAALARYHVAVAQIEGLIGRPLPQARGPHDTPAAKERE